MRIRNFILSHLENFDNKADINIKNYTIEHIMPQNSHLSKEWQDMLGANWKEIQKNYLHTIGNLTLTAYNERMSDNSFLKKRDMEGGFRESALRLNAYVVKQDRWDDACIRERAQLLSNKAKQVWPYPFQPEEKSIPDIQKTSREYTLETYSINEKMASLYEQLHTKIMNLSPSIRREYKKIILPINIIQILQMLRFKKSNYSALFYHAILGY